MRTKSWKFILNRHTALLFGAVFILASETAFAGADLVISPTRLVLDQASEAALTIVNTGTENMEITSRLVERSMGRHGDLLPDATYVNSAAPYVLYAPNRVVLPPGGSQIIRFVVRPLPPEGEYRSHLELLAVAPTQTYRLTLPVIVRRGRLTAEVTLNPVRFERLLSGRWRAEVNLNRSGRASTFGNLDFELVCASGTREVLGSKRGMAIYAENAVREVAYELDLPAAHRLSDCDVHALFHANGHYSAPVTMIAF